MAGHHSTCSNTWRAPGWVCPGAVTPTLLPPDTVPTNNQHWRDASQGSLSPLQDSLTCPYGCLQIGDGLFTQYVLPSGKVTYMYYQVRSQVICRHDGLTLPYGRLVLSCCGSLVGMG